MVPAITTTVTSTQTPTNSLLTMNIHLPETNVDVHDSSIRRSHSFHSTTETTAPITPPIEKNVHREHQQDRLSPISIVKLTNTDTDINTKKITGGKNNGKSSSPVYHQLKNGQRQTMTVIGTKPMNYYPNNSHNVTVDVRNKPDFNLPPMHTPLFNPRHTIHVKDTVLSNPHQNPQNQKQQQQQQQLRFQKRGTTKGVSIPTIPSLPKPAPFGKARRAVSDNQVQKNQGRETSGQRRSIFGHYFDPQRGQSPQPSSDSPSSSSSSLQYRRPQPFHTRPRSQSLNETSSHNAGSSVLSFTSSQPKSGIALPELQPLDYRMFAPPKSHANSSSICGRFESVADHSDPSLLSSKNDLPPLPSPLRRFCSEPKHGKSLIHGMYPLLTPISILRQSSYLGSSTRPSMSNPDKGTVECSIQQTSSDSYHRSSSNSSSSWSSELKSLPSSHSSMSVSELYDNPQTNATPDNSYHGSSNNSSTPVLNDQGSFNLTDSFRPKDRTSDVFSVDNEGPDNNEDRVIARRSLRNIGTLPTIASTGDMSIQPDDADDDGAAIDLNSDRDENMDTDGSYDGRRRSSSASSRRCAGASAGVRFDPRVTITEFEDEIERSWYTDWELEVLKRETVIVAQKYLVAHPLEALKYNEAKLDPVTSTYRKKALFSLPALSADAIPDDSTKAAKTAVNALPTDTTELEQLVQSQVKKILVVDPNPSILALFRKSMRTMFPHAAVITANSGEMAMKMSTEHQSFDIVIAEQCLSSSPSIHSAGGKMDRHRRNNTMPTNLSMPEIHDESLAFPALFKPGSFFEVDKHSIQSPGESRGPDCGAELIRMLAKKHYSACSQNGLDTAVVVNGGNSSRSTNTPSAMASGESSATTPPRPLALLIGVSMKPDRDAKILQEAGADIVWGKPIPRVGEALRNILLSLLLSKRRAVG